MRDHSRPFAAARSRRAGFSLVEAMVAVTVTAIAGSVLLLAIEASLRSTVDSAEQTTAQGIAKQIVDELLGLPYMDPDTSSPYQTSLTGSAWELAGAGRERMDDTDDYNNYSAKPVKSPMGVELGHDDGQGGLRHPNLQMPTDYFADWREEVEIYYVDADDPSVRLAAGRTSNYRAVEVRVYRDEPDGTSRLLAHIRRVYTYVSLPL